MATTTQSHIAKKLGISRSTVSRAFSRPVSVDNETRKRILAEAQKLEYVVNSHARALKTGRTNQLCFAVTNYQHLASYASQCRLVGLGNEATRLGYVLSLTLFDSSNFNGSPTSFAEVIGQRRFDGVLIYSNELEVNDPRIKILMKNKIPMVLMDAHIANSEIASVENDLILGTKAVAEHLLNHGRRKMFYFPYLSGSRYSHERYLGYERALTQAGIKVRPELVVELKQSDTGIDWWKIGYETTREIVQNKVDFDSIFCSVDDSAIGVLAALKELGVKVPDDIAVAGCDDIPAAMHCDPPLTTLRLNNAQIGTYAVRILDELIKNPKVVPQQLRLLPQLVVRRSCGCKQDNSQVS